MKTRVWIYLRHPTNPLKAGKKHEFRAAHTAEKFINTHAQDIKWIIICPAYGRDESYLRSGEDDQGNPLFKRFGGRR